MKCQLIGIVLCRDKTEINNKTKQKQKTKSNKTITTKPELLQDCSNVQEEKQLNITPPKDQGSAAYYMPYTIGKYELKYTSRIVTNG